MSECNFCDYFVINTRKKYNKKEKLPFICNVFVTLKLDILYFLNVPSKNGHNIQAVYINYWRIVSRAQAIPCSAPMSYN